jgi:hypothetical protein
VDPRFSRVLEPLRASRFAGLAGTRLSATIPIAERLLNDLLGASVPSSAPVRDVTVQPKPSNRLRVTAKLTRAEFLPPISVTLEIESQPVLPDSPLVLRILSLPGLLSLAGAALSISTLLPPGIKVQDQRVFVDVRVLLERYGYGEIVRYVESLRVTTEEGKLVLDVQLRVPAQP